MTYAVIDTNVVVSALVTKHSYSAAFKVVEHVFNGDVIPLYNDEIVEEYRDVLSRNKFHLTSSEIEAVIEYFIGNGVEVGRVFYDKEMPDEKDRVFYEISLSKEDSFLVTGNLKHFPVSPKVVSPAEFVRLMGF